MASFLVFTNLMGLFTALERLPESQFHVWFYSGRLLLLFCAFVFAHARRSKRFYVALFHEISESAYWRFVILGMFALKGIFLNRFVELSPTLQLLDLSVTVTIITVLLMTYQSHAWARDQILIRQKRLKRLVRRAKLSNEELEAITPELMLEAKRNQRMPLSWKLTTVFLALILSAMLDAYAGTVVDFLEELSGVSFLNIFPPY